MPEKSRKARPLRTAFLIFLSIIILAVASPFIYSLIGGFSDYDDIASLAGADGERALSVDDNGVVGFSADKAAVYSYASRMQLNKQITEYVSQLPNCSEKTVSISKFGYEIKETSISASAKVKLFGFLPIQLHTQAEVKFSPDEIRIKPSELKYGKWITLPLEKFAEKFDIPQITDGFIIDISDFSKEMYLVGLSAKDNVISFQCDIINGTAEQIGDTGAQLATLMPIVCGEDTDAARVLRGEGSEIYATICDSADLSRLLTDILKYGYETNAENTKPILEDIPFLDLEIGDVSVCSSGYYASLFETMNEYETQLTALRDNYKELHYSLSADGFYSSDGSRAEAVLPEAWGARTVLQYNVNFNSIVKVNDGSFSPAFGWTVLPNPKLSDLKRNGYVPLPNIPGITVFDLTLAIRSANGTPAILFLSALDELGFNIISEELYDEIISSPALPIYCSSDIIAPNNCSFVTPEFSQRDLIFYLP